jgi:hypothetical protein
MKRFFRQPIFTDKTTLILRQNWLVLSLPVCNLKGLTIVRCSQLKMNFLRPIFYSKAYSNTYQKTALNKYVACQRARGEERSS